MERFFHRTNQEISEIQGGKGQIRKIQKKQEGKNGGEKKMRFLFLKLHMWRFLYSCVLHRLGTPLCYCPHATLPQENPLVWEPPLQHKILLTS